jgi:hypothetical protein
VTVPDLSWWLQNFTRSAFRLETLAEYQVPQEAEMLSAFKRGEPIRMRDDHPWLLMVKRHCGAAKSMQRVRIVGNPPSEYERFELALYPYSSAAGEEVHVLDKRHALDEDFWLFDDQVVYVLRYDATGRFLGADAARDVLAYRRIRDLTLENSIPFAQYAARATRP